MSYRHNFLVLSRNKVSNDWVPNLHGMSLGQTKELNRFCDFDPIFKVLCWTWNHRL